LADVTLGQPAPQATRQLTVSTNQLYHFVLSATGGQATASARLTIQDARGLVVAGFTARAGATASTNVWLAAGTYQVTLGASTLDGAPLQDLRVLAQVLNTADPIDPFVIDPTAAPTAPAPTTTTTSPVVTPTAPLPTAGTPTTTAPPLTPTSDSSLLEVIGSL